MLEALSTSPNRMRTFAFLGVCCVSATAAVLVGISDNPPGIVLAFAAVAAFVLAVVHPWRTARRFLYLLLGSVVGFVVCAVLHNIFEGMAGTLEGMKALRITLQVLGVVTFLLAVLVGPPAILVGAVGSIVMGIRNYLQSRQVNENTV